MAWESKRTGKNAAAERASLLKPRSFIIPSEVLLAFTLAVPSLAEQRQCRAELESFYIADRCSSTLAECIKNHPTCLLALHLNAFAFWIDSLRNDEPCSSRVAALAERYASFIDTVRYAIDLHTTEFAGASNAPITLILYVSASCPLCKRVYKELYGEVTEGKLLNKAKMGIKVFSVRPGDMALLAAKKFNKQSEYILSLAGVEERISEKIIMQKAADIGLSKRTFYRILRDSALINEAQASAQEAGKNGVTIAPTVFINGKRYHGYKDPKWIVDAALYEYESINVDAKRQSSPF
jgi:glutaredoxin